jgi:hypothetical protein
MMMDEKSREKRREERDYTLERKVNWFYTGFLSVFQRFSFDFPTKTAVF